MSTVWRYSLRFEAAAVETHHRTASPLPGAHVVADIRGAAPGWNSALSLLSVVCVETSKAQGEEEEEEKTLLWNTSATAGYSPLSTPLWIYAPLKEEEYLCAWVQLVLVVISALSPERSFRISAHCFWKIFSASVRIFPLFLSRVCDNLQPTISSFSKILQPQLDHGHTQITR